MALETETSQVIFQGNAATTVFTYSFIIPNADVVVATFTDSDGDQTILSTSQYTITGLDDENGGTITYPLSGSPMAVGESLTLQRVVPYTQPTVLTNQGGYYPDVVEGADDWIVMQTQQLDALYQRTIRFPAVDPTANSQGELPAWQQRANMVLSFDSSGNPQLSSASGGGSPTSASLVNFLQRGTGAVSRTVQSKEQDIVSVMDFMTTAEKTAVLAKTFTTDVSANMQIAYNAASSSTYEGTEVWHPTGGYLANNLTFNDHTVLRGPLVNRGQWWANTGQGAVIRNAHATNHTLQGKGSGDYSLASAVIGLCLEATGGTSGAHIYLPDESNDVLIEGNSFQGAANGIRTLGSVYDVMIRRNFFQGQTAAQISKQADGGVTTYIEENYFRAGATQAILLSGGGSGLEVGWIVKKNIFTGFTGAGIALFDCTAGAIRICDFADNHFESNSGAGAYCVYALGDSWTVGSNQFDNCVNAFEAVTLVDSVFLPNRFSTLSGFAIQLDAATARCTVFPQVTNGEAITNNGTDGTNTMLGKTTASDVRAFTPHTMTEKAGSAGGNYSTNGGTFANIDGTNLSYTATIPTGWKLQVMASGVIQANGAATVTLGLLDGAIVEEKPIDIVAGVANANCFWVLQKTIAGDGSAHTVTVQWKTSANTATMLNSSATNAPRMELRLGPSY